MPETVAVVVSYDMKRQELVLEFPSSRLALAYQSRNCEARIFSNTSRHKVWLPTSPEMEYFRASSNGCGFVIGFASSSAASRWSQNSVLGQLHHHDNTNTSEVCIRSEWDRRDLDKRLSSSLSVAKPDSRHSPSRSPRAFDDIPPAQVSTGSKIH
jgi:hypothetical protein